MSATRDSEQIVLGALMSGADVADLSCTGADFDAPAHEVIFNAIVRVAAAGEQPDPVKVRFAIGADQDRTYGGALYLLELTERAPYAGASVGWHAQQVSEMAAKRRLRDLGARLMQITETDDPAVELLASARQVLDETDLGADRRTSVVSMETSIRSVVDQAQHPRRKGLSSPWPDLDRLTRGFYPGRLYVVGARPGIGKSLFASNSAVHAAKQGHGVFVASMEMSHVEWTQRCAAAEGKIDIGRLEEGKLEDVEWGRLDTIVPRIAALPIEINDQESQTVENIRASVRLSLRKVDHLGMIVVDYLQLLTASDRKQPRHEQVADMSRGLKRLAREFDVPVIALAQVNRASVQRQDAWPTMADLRESGSIEADADAVILLHTDPETPHLVMARLVKGRATAKGELTLQMQGHYSRLLSATQPAWSPSKAIGTA